MVSWRNANLLLPSSSPMFISFFAFSFHKLPFPLLFCSWFFSSIVVGFFFTSWTSYNTTPQFLQQRHIFFLLATMQLVLLLHVCCNDLPLAFFCAIVHLFHFIYFFISLICFFVCRSCFSLSLFCKRSHDDLVLLHLCGHWANSSNFSFVLSFHVWLPSILPLHCTLVNFFEKTNWNFKVFV